MYNGGTMNTESTNFQCTICYEIFLYPVRLPCNHRFCKLCLDRHMENNKMCCPICRFRVSNWLRQLRRNNADIVDKPFWETIQKLYPKEVERRTTGSIDSQCYLNYFRKRLAKCDDKEKSRCVKLHAAFLDLRHLQDWEGDWHGWPVQVYQVCRNILQFAIEEPVNETSPTFNDTPRRSLAKPGEIHQEYEQFLQKELEEKRRQEEVNFRLSEAMIRMIEEEERREEEERQKQLEKDEELARRLEEEANTESERTLIEERTRVPRTPRRRRNGSQKLQQDNMNMSAPHTQVCHNTPSTCKEDHQDPHVPACLNTSTPSTSKQNYRCPQSTDTQSTSKKNIFAKFYSKTPSISNKEFSHFATVQPGPSIVGNGSKTKRKKSETVPSSSRCSSGCDSIGQELNHFKPIRSSPTTPPKEGSRGPVPKLVVAQRGVGVPDLSRTPSFELLSADVSLDDLETSINLEKQLEEDKRLAMEIQNQFNEEMKMPAKADYNLRKRKRQSGSLKKKVLIDRTQTTLDNLLIN